MTKETMTIHEALSELKVLDSRIESAIAGKNYAIAHKKSAEKVAGKKVTTIIEDAEKALQSAFDLIARRKAIRNALSLSNAVTKVNIGGVEYTVAEAIEMRKEGMQYKKLIADTLTRQLYAAKDDANRANTKLDEAADKYVTGLFSTKESLKSAEAQAVRDAYVTQNTVEVSTVRNIEERIAEIKTDCDTFYGKVDSAISVSNAVTQITIEY